MIDHKKASCTLGSIAAILLLAACGGADQQQQQQQQQQMTPGQMPMQGQQTQQQQAPGGASPLSAGPAPAAPADPLDIFKPSAEAVAAHAAVAGARTPPKAAAWPR